MATDSRHCSFKQFQQGEFQICYLSVRGKKQNLLSAALEKGWGLCQVDDISRLRGEKDVASTAFRVRAGGEHYLLKEISGPEPSTHEESNRCLMFCKERGIGVPFVRFTTEGKTCHGRNPMISLYEFIDGEHFDGSRKELKETAAALGELDRELSKAPCASALQKVKGRKLSHDRLEAEALFREIRCAEGRGHFDAGVLRWLDYIEDRLRALASFDFNSVPFQLSHTNIHPHNLLFSKETQALLAFVGFGAVYYTQRIRGVAYAMHRLSRAYGEETEGGEDIGVDIRVRAEEFLKAYDSANPLREEELKALRFILGDEALCRVLTLLRRHYIKKNFDTDSALGKRLTLLRETELFDFL